MELYSPSAVERAMRVQEVILRAMSGELKWHQAARIIGVTDRTMRRWKQRYQEFGYDGLLDRRRGRPSPKAVPFEEVQRILHLYREKYLGFNVRHFHQIAQREHGLKFSYSFVKNALQGAGLVKKQKARGRHFKRREPKAHFGEMLHLDGSPHEWLALCPGEEQTLIAILDDATNKLLYAQLWPSESSEAVMSGLKAVVGQEGIPMSLYTDRASWAFHTPKAGGKVDKSNLTQVGRALAVLGVEHIPAYSPQARGRGERLNRTLQDRLVNELRLHEITDIDAANAYLRERFIPQYNADFARPPREAASAFVTTGETDLDQVFCIEEERVVNNDNTVSFDRVLLQISKQPGHASCSGMHVKVRRHLEGSLSIWKGQKVLGRYQADGSPIKAGNGNGKGRKAGFQGMEGSRMSKEREGSPKAPSSDIPSPSSGYPSAGCSPAAPASVLPDV